MMNIPNFLETQNVLSNRIGKMLSDVRGLHVDLLGPYYDEEDVGDDCGDTQEIHGRLMVSKSVSRGISGQVAGLLSAITELTRALHGDVSPMRQGFAQAAVGLTQGTPPTLPTAPAAPPSMPPIPRPMTVLEEINNVVKISTQNLHTAISNLDNALDILGAVKLDNEPTAPAEDSAGILGSILTEQEYLEATIVKVEDRVGALKGLFE